MTDTISALWNGDLAFCEHCGAYDDQANRLVGEMARCRDKLSSQLNKEQSLLLQSCIDQAERYTLRMMELAFRDGFCVGVQLLSEALHGT